MTLYCVLNNTSQSQPWIELVTEHKSVAQFCCDTNQKNGLFSIVVEKQLNLLPDKKFKKS